MDNLEHALWQAIEEGPRAYGQIDISHEHIKILDQLSKEAEGWWTIQDHKIEFVSIEQWKNIYSREKALNIRLKVLQERLINKGKPIGVAWL